MEIDMKKKNLCLIPARGGSKGIPFKNIQKVSNKPLIEYSINAAKESKLINRIIVSTDSKQIASFAKKLIWSNVHFWSPFIAEGGQYAKIYCVEKTMPSSFF